MLKNINWKVRLKNPTFWAQIIIAVISPILVGLLALSTYIPGLWA